MPTDTMTKQLTGKVAFVTGGSRGIGAAMPIQPGSVAIDMNPVSGLFTETLKGFMALKRNGEGAEIVGLVSYLADPDVEFITGASLTIDGGFSA